MERWNVILGVDISKLTLDISCAEQKLHLQVKNDAKGFRVFNKWCCTHGIEFATVLVLMEHTGGYEHRFCQYCRSCGIPYLRVPGLEIKNSMGITRGKNDKDDSYRIGQYGERRIKELHAESQIDENILKIKQLLSFRKRLVRGIAGLLASVKERGHMYDLDRKDPIMSISREKIAADKKYLLQIENEIKAIINLDGKLLSSYRILTSIKGIGPVNAWMTIVYTENFISFTDGRKYAVYTGVIPFNNRSGTSIRGKDKVSHIANKELKQELNQAAKTAIIHDPEIRNYAKRKLETKPYPLVLNNVKFKLIMRMFSLIKRNEMYVENYKRAA